MTAAESQQLGELLTEVKNLRTGQDDLKKCQEGMRNEMADIKITIANISGGKQALLWFGGVIFTVSGLIIGYLNLKKGK